MSGYVDPSTGKWVHIENITLQPSITKGASFTSATVESRGRPTVCLDLAVTAGSGTTPTLDVVVETSKDGTTWRSLGAFAQKTGVATERKSFVGADRYLRANATLGGTTPSFTYLVSGEAK